MYIMKNLSRLFFLIVILSGLLTTTSCKKTAEEQNQYAELEQHLLSNDQDLGEIIKYHGNGHADGLKFVAYAKDETTAQAFIDKYYIVDIRKSADFEAGHIEGAVNTTLDNLLAEAANAGSKPILMVCYTGQTACFATACLRLAGYPETQALKWGMSGWNSDFDKWTPNLGNVAEGHANWTTDAAPSLQAFSSPVLITDMTSPSDILMERVRVVLSQGFKGVDASDVLNNPSDYFINNFFSEAHYTGFGHINGAYRILPLGLSNGSIGNLDPDQKVVTYCYTGQTSGVITAYLRVLGYDAYSLKFGMNALYNSNSTWSANQWGGDSGSKDFPVVQ